MAQRVENNGNILADIRQLMSNVLHPLSPADDGKRSRKAGDRQHILRRIRLSVRVEGEGLLRPYFQRLYPVLMNPFKDIMPSPIGRREHKSNGQLA